MAQIVINEISQSYSYNIGNNSFATVALPITACWGPGYFDYQAQANSSNPDLEEFDILEYTTWAKFPATQAGLESFVSTYRGPSSVYRLAQDYSYQMAMTLLTAGYDVLVCRVSPGTQAQGMIKVSGKEDYLAIKAKYPGTFGNSLRVEVKRVPFRKRVEGVYVQSYYWNILTSIIDDSGIKTSVENLNVVFELDNATDSLVHWTEIDSNFISLSVVGDIADSESTEFISVYPDGTPIPESELLSQLPYTDLTGASDKAADPVADAELQAAVTAAIQTLAENQATYDNLYKDVDESGKELLDKYENALVAKNTADAEKESAEAAKTAADDAKRAADEAEAEAASAKADAEDDLAAVAAERDAAEAAYHTAVETHGEDSPEAARAKARWDEAEESLIVSQEYVAETTAAWEQAMTAQSSAEETLLAADAMLSEKAQVAITANAQYDEIKSQVEEKIPNAAELIQAEDDLEAAKQALAAAQSALDANVYEQLIDEAVASARDRFGKYYTEEPQYIANIDSLKEAESPDVIKAESIRYMEWLYTSVVGTSSKDGVYDLLKDKLTYNPNRVISPGWDDQNSSFIFDEDIYEKLTHISPIHLKLMDVAYYSRCATGMIDIPKSEARSAVYNDSIKPTEEGYAQKLARYIPTSTTGDINGSLYQTHSALFAPWGKYTYVGTSKQSPASPAFLGLMIERAQILNQPNQYEWALPTNRKHSLRIGKMDYNVPKKYLDEWQTLEGVGVNVITTIPDLGTNIWGNSTLFEVPPATYQALANLSTRYLVNAIEDVVYRVGIGITFSYNNEQAYNKFYAGVTPILDTMRNVGAIDGYYVRMSADINNLDAVNANTVVGKIYLIVNGVINDVIVDLVALPPGSDLSQYSR